MANNLIDLDEFLSHNDVEFNEENLEIAHHGIDGMRWGHKNGPPYPLHRNQLSSAERKAIGSGSSSSSGSSGGSSYNSRTVDGTATVIKEGPTIKDQAKNGLDKVNKASKTVSKISGNNKKHIKKQTRDLSNVSNEEMSSALKRHSLEEQYNKMLDEAEYKQSTQYKIDQAIDRVRDVAVATAAVSGAALSAIKIAEEVKNLKHDDDSEFIEHHGINGQKWGELNGPPYPLDYDDHSGSEKRQNSGSDISAGDKKEKGLDSDSNYDASEKNTKSESSEKTKSETKSKSKSSDSKKTDFIDAYTDQLVKSGMSEKEARQKAVNYDRATKVAIAVGAGILVAGSAYCLYRYKNANLDSIIKAGEGIQRVDINDAANAADAVKDFMYATREGSHDAKKYTGMFAKTRSLQGFDTYQKIFKAQGDIKVAGLNTGEKIFNKVIKTDPEFKDLFPGDQSYAHFNRQMCSLGHKTGAFEDSYVKIYKKFFEAVKSEGYGAIIDYNDSYHSGYGAAKPLIILGGLNNLSDATVTKLSKTSVYDEAFKNSIEGLVLDANWTDDTAATTAIMASAITAIGGIRLSNEKKVVENANK